MHSQTSHFHTCNGTILDFNKTKAYIDCIYCLIRVPRIMLMKMLRLLKQSIALFWFMLILSFVVNYSGVHNEMTFTILGVSLFTSSVITWFLPLIIVLANNEVQRKGLILLLSLSFPVFGGIISYLILIKQVRTTTM